MDDGCAALVAAAVRHAAENFAFYRRRQPVEPSGPGDLELRGWPIVSRPELAALADEALRGRSAPQFIGVTSGTGFRAGSSRPMVLRVACEAERETARQLAKGVSNGERRKPLAMRIVTSAHGLDFVGPVTGVFGLPLERVEHVDLAIDLLSRRFEFTGFSERVELLVGPTNLIGGITSALADRGASAADFGICSVLCFGAYLSAELRSSIENYWGVGPTDVYGLSEAPGVCGISCGQCGDFHFLPTAFTELVALSQDRPCLPGEAGRLVVTTYFPLVEAMPLIRYDTGDVFRCNGSCCGGQTRYEFLGRMEDLIWVSDRTAFVSRAQLDDLTLETAPVARSRDPRLRGLELRRPTGRPIYEVTSQVDGLVVSYDFDLAMPPKIESSFIDGRIMAFSGTCSSEVPVRFAPRVQELNE
ncbi:MAG TPA: hypothetical protein VN240_02150 [Propylenella sp.]|nr:hypothetical protein [Propylenella sp.]